jgi:preprotein translocase subunit SecA
MFRNLAKFLGGDSARRELEAYAPWIEDINRREAELQRQGDDDLREASEDLRRRARDGAALEDLLPEAFALVREASVRTIGLRHFDVQLLGGILLHDGRVAEMRTGEGKTLVATLPLYLNALAGSGVHLVTVNDYLARRDARWMGPVYRLLGLSVGVLQEAARTENGRKAFVFDPEVQSTHEDIDRLRMVDRRQAYAADITYGTNNEFGFDYLRDNMAHSLEARVQRGHHFAILDEVDNILIDEARTPLIISGPSQEDPRLYEQMARVVKQLAAEDFEVNEKDRTVALTEIGEEHVEQLLGTALRDPDRPEDITPEQARLLGHLEQALRAEHLFRRNKDYVVQGGRVVIVDEFTGRLMAGRRWSDGLHQAVEAKEGVKVRQDNVTYATITLQNYFRKYAKLAGMTGTALTEAEEFHKIYKVDVVSLPTNLEYMASRPGSDLVEAEYREDGQRFHCFARAGDAERRPVFWRRKDYPDVVYRTEEAKLRAVAAEILRRHILGQPLLVGTTSVELSEKLSARLRAEPLQRLALALVLRRAYLEHHNLPDDGVRVEALDPLYRPLDQLAAQDLRAFARDLDLPPSPLQPEMLDHLLAALELAPDHRDALARVLQSGIRHNVLNAKKHDEESRIIADAGALGAVTIATNMAGRGVDIKLGGEVAEEVLASVNRVLRRANLSEPEMLSDEEKLHAIDAAGREAVGIYQAELELFREFLANEKKVKDAGGLHVLGSVRHEARRIDNQLRGRAARQGDPGSSQFFLSLEDELMRLFGGAQVSGLMQRFNFDDAVPIAHSLVDKTIEQAQSRVEGANFETRKHLLEYDDVLNQQREVYYGQRNRVFVKEDLDEDLRTMLEVEIERRVRASQEDTEGNWKLLAWLEEIQPSLNVESERPYPSLLLQLLLEQLEAPGEAQSLPDRLKRIASATLEAQHEHLLQALENQLDRSMERLDEQVRQRVELAETALEGAEIEAQESGRAPEVRAQLAAVEQAAGIRIQADEANLQALRQDPRSLRKAIPQLVEASLALRVWTSVVAWVENRLGESLGLAPRIPTPFDWEEVQRILRQSLEKAIELRTKRILAELDAELVAAVPPGGNGSAETLDKGGRLRLLVRMAYAPRAVFDRRTHQRRTLMVARLSYPFYAASLIQDLPPADLQARILEHLSGARQAIHGYVGRAELLRLGQQTLESLDDRIQSPLRQQLNGDPGDIFTRPAAELREDDAVSTALGRVLLTQAYRSLLLSVGDRLWVEYLTQMEALRTSIGLEAYGQRDPLVQYKSRAFDMFQQLLSEIRAGVVGRMFRFQVRSPAPAAQEAGPAEPAAAQASAVGSEASSPESARRRRRRRHR